MLLEGVDGVGHIIYTSVATDGDHLAFALAHRWTERRIQSAELSWTILRNGIYAELFGSLLASVGGVITAPFASGALVAVTRADLAEAAANVARSPGDHVGRVYDLVGARSVTATQIAAGTGLSYGARGARWPTPNSRLEWTSPVPARDAAQYLLNSGERIPCTDGRRPRSSTRSTTC